MTAKERAQATEMARISPKTAKVEGLSTESQKTPQSQNKCRVSSVLAQAHELYNAAFIGGTQRIY